MTFMEKWSDSQVDLLCSLLAQGKTMSECALAMKMTRSTVAGKIMRLKTSKDSRLPKDRNTSRMMALNDRTNELADLLAEGVDFKDCIDIMRVNRSIAYRYFKRMREGLGWQAA